MEVVIDVDEQYPYYSLLTEIPTWRAKKVITIPDEDYLRIEGVFEEFRKVQRELRDLFKRR